MALPSFGMVHHKTMLKDGNPYSSKANQIDKNVRGKLFTALSSEKA
jgi:hypothetical protein